MRLKHLMLAGAMAVAGGLLASPVLARSCPEGTPGYEQGKDVTSLAQCSLTDDSDSSQLFTSVSDIINVVLGIVSIVAVIVIIIGGVSFVTSQGDAAKVVKGRNTIIYGLVGLFIALLAFAIVNFVLTSVFNGTSSTTSSETRVVGSNLDF